MILLILSKLSSIHYYVGNEHSIFSSSSSIVHMSQRVVVAASFMAPFILLRYGGSCGGPSAGVSVFRFFSMPLSDGRTGSDACTGMDVLCIRAVVFFNQFPIVGRRRSSSSSAAAMRDDDGGGWVVARAHRRRMSV